MEGDGRRVCPTENLKRAHVASRRQPRSVGPLTPGGGACVCLQPRGGLWPASRIPSCAPSASHASVVKAAGGVLRTPWSDSGRDSRCRRSKRRWNLRSEGRRPGPPPATACVSLGLPGPRRKGSRRTRRFSRRCCSDWCAYGLPGHPVALQIRVQRVWVGPEVCSLAASGRRVRSPRVSSAPSLP